MAWNSTNLLFGGKERKNHPHNFNPALLLISPPESLRVCSCSEVNLKSFHPTPPRTHSRSGRSRRAEEKRRRNSFKNSKMEVFGKFSLHSKNKVFRRSKVLISSRCVLYSRIAWHLRIKLFMLRSASEREIKTRAEL